MKTKKNSVAFLLMLFFSLTVFYFLSKDAALDGPISVTNLLKLPENSIERYAYSKAFNNGTEYKDELQKEKNMSLALKANEEVAYITKTQKAGEAQSEIGVLNALISSELKVIVNRDTKELIRVCDFGSPYAYIEGEKSEWRCGGFNFNPIDDKKIRLSSTGQFEIYNGRIKSGGDISLSSRETGALTKVMTIHCVMGW